MFDSAKNIVVALLIFTVIVVIHELGHFLLAKKNGIGVIEFSVCMGPRLITVVKTEKGIQVRFFVTNKEFENNPDWKDRTKYSLKLIPLGGACMMVGEDEIVEAENSFNKKSVWARMSVVFAGPFFNFILAFLVSIVIISQGGVDIPEVLYVQEGKPGYEAGIEEGDRIQSINGKKIVIGRDVTAYEQFGNMDEELEIVVLRDEKKVTLSLNPVYETYLFGFGYENSEREPAITALTEEMPFEKAGMKVGDVIVSVNGEEVKTGAELNAYIQKQNIDGSAFTFVYKRDGKEKEVTIEPEPYTGKTLGFVAGGEAKTNAAGVLKYSLVEVRYWIETTIKSVGQLVTGRLSAKDLAGPVGIVDMVGNVIEESEKIETEEDQISPVILNLLYMMVLLSANLGVMNLLPIPALDGGRLVFLIIEAVRGKPIDQEKEGIVHVIGFILLMLLMAYVMFNDFSRIFTR